jgi:hypothetical protein
MKPMAKEGNRFCWKELMYFMRCRRSNGKRKKIDATAFFRCAEVGSTHQGHIVWFVTGEFE